VRCKPNCKANCKAKRGVQALGLPNAIAIYRVAHRLALRGHLRTAKLLETLIFLLYNSVVPSEAEIGEGSELGYRGIGVVIHERARIGQRVMIGPNVTIGGRSGHAEVPVIEDDVYIATGAKVLGPIRVGKGAVIGANAVVIRDVPAGAVVAGVPARVIKQSEVR
jgi:serine O-acetyltransferase